MGIALLNPSYEGLNAGLGFRQSLKICGNIFVKTFMTMFSVLACILIFALSIKPDRPFSYILA